MTGDSKHTPGPWIASEPDQFNDITINRGPEEPLAIAAVVNGEMRRMGGKLDEHEANARLIAAAPLMLEALMEIQQAAQEAMKGDATDQSKTMFDVIDLTAGDALARAKGAET